MDSVYEVTSNLSLHHFFFFFVCVQKSDIKMFKFSESNIHYTALIFSFPDLEPVCCSLFNSNCCFLTGIHISQGAGKVVWYSHLFRNFPQFVVIHERSGRGQDERSGQGQDERSGQGQACRDMSRQRALQTSPGDSWQPS